MYASAAGALHHSGAGAPDTPWQEAEAACGQQCQAHAGCCAPAAADIACQEGELNDLTGFSLALRELAALSGPPYRALPMR